MAYAQLKSRYTSHARVEEISRDAAHYHLSLPSGSADAYQLAQLDDYTQFSRTRFPHHLSRSLSLSARASSDSIPGTWGFGLWNDPFGLSLGFGGKPFRLPALPNAVWLFGASPENYLSFKNTIKRGDPTPTNPANGFLAQTFRSPKFHPLLILAGLVLPFSRRTTRQLLSRVIEEDGVQLWSPRARSRFATSPEVDSKIVDPTQWHRYRLDWSRKYVSFDVDAVHVFESLVSPNPPLGLVIWIDNQYAAFTPEGKIGFGVLEHAEPAWLEVKEVELT